MEIRLVKQGSLFALFAKDYQLLRDGLPCGEMEFLDWKIAGFSIDGSPYAIRSDGKATWELTKNGITMAHCERLATGLQLEFSIRFDSRTWSLKPVRINWMLCHEVWENDRMIGSITPLLKWLRPEIGAHFESAQRLEQISFATLASWYSLGRNSRKIDRGACPGRTVIRHDKSSDLIAAGIHNRIAVRFYPGRRTRHRQP